ncbi:MAG: GldG family protein [Clostridia bacterium]|nr:GldG family protein [Clostridia bacterium]
MNKYSRLQIVTLMQEHIRNKSLILLSSILLFILCLLTYAFSFEIDLTRNDANSISSKSKSIVKGINLDDEIDVYYFQAITNAEIDNRVNDRINIVFEQLKKYNSKINYHIIDMAKDPNALVKFNQAETKSILIEYKDKSITIPFDKFVYSYDNILEVTVEKVLVDEFIKLKDLDNYKIYYTNTHGEKFDSIDYSDFQSLIKNLGYEANGLDISQEIPDEVKTLYVLSPQYDFTEEEVDRLKMFVARGNSLFISLSSVSAKDNILTVTECPNLISFCHDLGINVGNKVIVDQIQDTKLIGVYSLDDEEAIKLESINPIVYMPSSRMMTVSSVIDKYHITPTMISGELASYPLILKLTNENTKVLLCASAEMFSNSYMTDNKIFGTYLIGWVDNFETNSNIDAFIYREYVADPNEFKSSLILGIIDIMIPLLALYIGYEITRKRIANTKSKIMK